MITKINNNSKRTRLLPVYNGYLFLIHYVDKNELMPILGGSSKIGIGFEGAETNCDD